MSEQQRGLSYELGVMMCQAYLQANKMEVTEVWNYNLHQNFLGIFPHIKDIDKTKFYKGFKDEMMATHIGRVYLDIDDVKWYFEEALEILEISLIFLNIPDILCFSIHLYEISSVHFSLGISLSLSSFSTTNTDVSLFQYPILVFLNSHSLNLLG